MDPFQTPNILGALGGHFWFRNPSRQWACISGLEMFIGVAVWLAENKTNHDSFDWKKVSCEDNYASVMNQIF